MSRSPSAAEMPPAIARRYPKSRWLLQPTEVGRVVGSWGRGRLMLEVRKWEHGRVLNVLLFTTRQPTDQMVRGIAAVMSAGGLTPQAREEFRQCWLQQRSEEPRSLPTDAPDGRGAAGGNHV